MSTCTIYSSGTIYMSKDFDTVNHSKYANNIMISTTPPYVKRYSWQIILTGDKLQSFQIEAP